MAAYPLAPWIGPPESITKSFATGLGLASEIANARAKMDEDAASQQLWANLEQQKQAQQAAYQQQGLLQDQQRLVMEQQAQQLKAQEAQRQVDAWTGYQNAIANKMDPIQAALQYLPGMGDSMAGIGALARQLQMSKNYAQPLPDPRSMINPATQQAVGGYYTRGTEGEPEWTPFTSGKVDPIQMLIMRDEMKGYDDKVTRAENALRDLEKKAFTDDEIKAALGSLRAGQPNDRALATVKAYRRDLEEARKAIADAERDRQAYRQSLGQSLGQQPTAQVAPPGMTPPPPGTPTPRRTAAPAAPGAGAQFTYDPATDTYVPRGQQPPSAPAQGGGSDILGTGLGLVGQAMWPKALRPTTLLGEAREALKESDIQYPGSKRITSEVGSALKSVLSPKASHKIGIPDSIKREVLDALDDQQLYDLYVSLTGKRPALKEGTRQELVDLIKKLKQQ